MARRNRTRFTAGKEVLTAPGSDWNAQSCIAFARRLKQHDPLMVVALYPTNDREALKAAVEAVGLRWRYVGSEELELMRELDRLRVRDLSRACRERDLSRASA